ncbi:hypothetical protein DFH09DRAFT_1277148 [Mycena vulgaris]|nr:hypothetical protein DFH09DRAFT_1277148 [Mycena vulgaris]
MFSLGVFLLCLQRATNEELPELNTILRRLQACPAGGRRALAATSPAPDDDRPSSAALPSLPAPSSPSENGGPGHAGTAFAGGAHVAYDPRDLLLEADEDAHMGGRLVRLTPVEEGDQG